MVEEQKSDEHYNNHKDQEQPDQESTVNSFAHKSAVLRSAVHGLSELMNTRLTSDALDLCLELLEAGVHPRPLIAVVSDILEVKEQEAAKKKTF